MAWFIYSPIAKPTLAPPRDIAFPSGSWSQPPPQVRQIQYQAYTSPFFTETTTADKWFNPFSVPVRVKPRLADSLQQVLALVEASPFTESVTEDRWHQPWSEPIRLRVRPEFLAALQQVQPPNPFGVTVPETVSYDKFSYPWSEPVRIKPALPSTEQHVLEFQPTPVVSFGWYNWLSDPVRIKPALLATEQHFFEFEPEPPEFFDIPWFNWLSEPVRIKLALPTQEQHVFEFQPTPIISIGWYNWFSEPVRQKLGLLAPLQQFYTADTVQIPSSAYPSWFNWLSEPVRTKLALAATEQQFFEFEPQPEVPFFWIYPYSEPVRIKPALLQTEQHFFEFEPEPPVLEEIPWFNWLAEPVRIKPYLWTGLQQSFITDLTFPGPPPGGTSRFYGPNVNVFPGYQLPDPKLQKKKPPRPVWDYGAKVERPAPAFIQPIAPSVPLPPPLYVLPSAKMAYAPPPDFRHMMPKAGVHGIQAQVETGQDLTDIQDMMEIIKLLGLE